MDSLNRYALELTDAATLPRGLLKYTISGTIGLISPQKSLIDWRPLCVKEFDEVAISMADFFNQWVLPFLDSYQCSSDLIAGFEGHDDRLSLDHATIIRIAAAYLDIGNPHKARDLICEEFYGKMGLRKQYHQALKYVGLLV